MKSFGSALDQSNAKQLQRGGGKKLHSHAMGSGERLHHGDLVIFFAKSLPVT